MATKLKKVKLNSVDFVGNGANQDAYFRLMKSRNIPANEKSLWKLFRAFLKGESAYSDEEITEMSIAKAKKAIREENQIYTSILKESIDTIVSDDNLDYEEKYRMMCQSIEEFHNIMNEAIQTWSDLEESITRETINEADKNREKEGEEEMMDKSKLTPEELKQYEILREKAKAEEKENDPAFDTEDESRQDSEKKKRLKTDRNTRIKEADNKEEHVIEKALTREMEILRQNMAAMKEKTEKSKLKEIAKRYAPLGKKEDELVETLYKMKQSSEDTFDEYISLMDQNLELVDKSGLFAEIGRSGNTGKYIKNNTDAKIAATAAEIKKSNPELNHFQAIEKAWEQNPEIAAAYEKEYAERRK